MLREDDPVSWQPFFTAMIAAAAALTGLLFVAVSINLERIVEGTGLLPTRAAETVATLLLVVVTSALVLIPQRMYLLGLEVLVLAVPMLVITVRSQICHLLQNPHDPLLWSISRMACTAVATVPGTAAGFSLVTLWAGGLYWLAATALLGVVGAVYNAWVLLVEIVR